MNVYAWATVSYISLTNRRTVERARVRDTQTIEQEGNDDNATEGRKKMKTARGEADEKQCREKDAGKSTEYSGAKREGGRAPGSAASASPPEGRINKGSEDGEDVRGWVARNGLARGRVGIV